ncbi:MAG: GNAT family N-acetyltransferase [Anaerolineales bacterium]|nr:GNAT family N-acetyltransferase [Anaerolineales bacterium]
MRHLEQVCFPLDSWPLLDLIGVLTFPGVIRLKAVTDNIMVGFIAGDIRDGKRLGWITTLCVLPEYQGRGIGGALLEACEKQIDAPTIRLNVRISNRAAIRLYRRYGYEQVSIWPGYYHDGEDAFILEKKIYRKGYNTDI